MKRHLTKLSIISYLTVSTATSFGAGTIFVSSDGSGNFTDAASLGAATWSGDGTVTPNLNGSGTTTIVSSITTGGTLSVGNFRMNAGTPYPYINGDITNTGIGLDITIETTGDAGRSFSIGGRNDTAGSSAGWRNFQVTNMIGVETLTVTYSFSAPVASMRGTPSPAPYLIGMRRAVGAGTYNATGTIANLTVDGAAYNQANFPFAEFMTEGNAVWDNTTGIGSIIAESTSATFNSMTRLDLDGDGAVLNPQGNESIITNGTLDEIERTYATGMTWTIENDGVGNFEDNSEFYFSFNGVQYPDSYSAVPEPASVSLLLIGLSLSLGYRKRSN